MAKVSALIPSRNEQFLTKTVADLLSKATGDVEVIVVLDGYWPNPYDLPEDKRLIVIHRGSARGMRGGINFAAAVATGQYLMKIDAHCMVSEGWDEVLQADCAPDWVVVPRRKRLDAENWCIQDVGKPDIDYELLSYPNNADEWGGAGLHGHLWNARNADLSLRDRLIDDKMSFQGSCWFMHRDYFYWLELMDEEHYGMFHQEAQEIGLKAWLSGGRVIVNKKAWYAHLHKGKKYGRGYHLPGEELQKGVAYTNRWIDQKVWHKQTRPLAWLVEHFWPVPEWPDNWRELLPKEL